MQERGKKNEAGLESPMKDNQQPCGCYPQAGAVQECPVAHSPQRALPRDPSVPSVPHVQDADGWVAL